MAPPPDDPPGGITVVQVLWAVVAVLGIVWGLLLGLIGWVFRMGWGEIKALRERVHEVEGEQKGTSGLLTVILDRLLPKRKDDP